MIMMQISNDNHESFEKMLMLAHLSESGGDGDGAPMVSIRWWG